MAVTATDQFTSLEFRKVLGHFPTGVAIITSTEAEGQPVGLAVGSFTSVSLDPPLVGFFPARTSSSFPRIRDSGRFCVNILGAHQAEVSRTFAQPGGAKFAETPYRMSPGGCPVIDGAVAWIDCEIESVTDAGDHLLCLGRVRTLEVASGGPPLVFVHGRYVDLVPAPPPRLHYFGPSSVMGLDDFW